MPIINLVYEAPNYYKPGIYYKSDLGLISLSSDGENWITIADKNLGATEVWSGSDTVNTCRSLFQWGNCYGFPYASSSGTSTKVNAGTYGPGNYYYGSTFINSSNTWDSSGNNNLRGDVTDTLVARQGPCDSGFHIPKSSEFSDIYNVGIALGAWTSTGSANMRTYLKLPRNGFKTNSSGGSFMGSFGFYWSSSISGTQAKFLQFQNNASEDIHYDNSNERYIGMGIRPFKNEAVTPTSSWTVLYQPS